MAEEDGGQPCLLGPCEQCSQSSIPSPPSGILLKAANCGSPFQGDPGLARCVCMCVRVCACMCTDETVCASPSLIYLKNHHTGVKKGDGLQLPGTVRHPSGAFRNSSSLRPLNLGPRCQHTAGGVSLTAGALPHQLLSCALGNASPTGQATPHSAYLPFQCVTLSPTPVAPTPSPHSAQPHHTRACRGWYRGTPQPCAPSRPSQSLAGFHLAQQRFCLMHRM